MIVLNLKTYAESTGENAKRLLNAINQFVSDNPNLLDKIIVAPSITDLFSVKQNYPNLHIASQHVDNVAAGSSTGWVPADTLISYGVEYVIYNHSEHRVDQNNIIENIKALQSKGLKVIVGCENADEAANLLNAQPFAIAFEPKDLIGSGVSVTTRPEAVKSFIEVTAGKTNSLIGAGVSKGEDVVNAKNLGAQGALLTSAFVKAADPLEKLRELVTPFA